MSRNGSGEYTPPNSSWSPAVNGTLATSGDWTALLNDLSAALTQSVSRDGQSPLTGPLNAGNNPINNVTAGTGTGQALAFQQLFNQGTMQDLASAATTDIGLQNTNFLRITGNTTITSFGTNYRGPRFLVFEGAVTLTNSSTLVLPGNANITTAAGDVLIAIPGATLGTADKWIVAAYQRKNGVYVDASGNVGIGTSSPGQKLTVGANGVFRLQTGSTTMDCTPTPGATDGFVWNTSASSYYDWSIGGTSRARIDSSGNLLVGTTSGDGRLHVKTAGNTGGDWGAQIVNSSSTLMFALLNNGNFYTGSAAGSPYNATTGAGANCVIDADQGRLLRSTSSLKYKTNVQDATHGLAQVMALRPVTYKGINDGDKVFGGLIAEEVHEAGLTEFVQYAEDGTPDALAYANMVSLAFKAIQEQQQLITALTARVSALEAA